MRKTQVRAGATLIAIPVAAWFAFQLAWIYFMQAQLYLHGWTDKGFYPYAYGAAGAAATLTLTIAWLTRSKKAEQETLSMPKREREKLERYWQLLKKTGKPEQMEEFKLEHPEFFGLTQAEMAEQPNSMYSSSPKTAPASLPSPETTHEGNEIVIRTPRENLAVPQASLKPENNGFDNKVDQALEKLLLKSLDEGNLNTNITIKRIDGKFTLPENFEFSLKKQAKPETNLAIPDKKENEKPKLDKVQP